MDHFSYTLLEKVILVETAMKKQEKWRQKQIDIFYRQGRPIFVIYNYKKNYFYF